jgi:hypothetical protein
MSCYVFKTGHPSCVRRVLLAPGMRFVFLTFESVIKTSGCSEVKNGDYNEELRDCFHIAYASFLRLSKE